MSLAGPRSGLRHVAGAGGNDGSPIRSDWKGQLDHKFRRQQGLWEDETELLSRLIVLNSAVLRSASVSFFCCCSSHFSVHARWCHGRGGRERSAVPWPQVSRVEAVVKRATHAAAISWPPPSARPHHGCSCTCSASFHLSRSQFANSLYIHICATVALSISQHNKKKKCLKKNAVACMRREYTSDQSRASEQKKNEQKASERHKVSRLGWVRRGW